MLSGTPLNSDINSFSLENYFQHIKSPELISAPANMATLKKIITEHNRHFPYRNTALFNEGKVPITERKVPSLDKDLLYPFMLKYHGGYCFQQLELLHNVLFEMGFKIDRYVAKIILQPCSTLVIDDTDQLKTHELLIAHLDDKKYIVDSGMCQFSLREPLELKAGIQTIADDQYRLTVSENGRWSLDTKNATKNAWFCIYQFFHTSVTYEDIKKHHENLYLTPEHRTIRDDKHLIGVVTPEKRKFVCWFTNSGKPDHGIFVSIKKNHAEEKRKELRSLDEVKEYTYKKFGF